MIYLRVAISIIITLVLLIFKKKGLESIKRYQEDYSDNFSPKLEELVYYSVILGFIVFIIIDIVKIAQDIT